MNNLVKFRLLMHMRWKAQFRCKTCIIVEIVVPFLILFVLALLRTFISDEKSPRRTYEAVRINEIANMENVRAYCPDSNFIKDVMSSFPNAKPFASRDQMEKHLRTFDEDKNVGVQFFHNSTDTLDKNITIGFSFGNRKINWFMALLFPAGSSNAKFLEPSQNAGGQPYYYQYFIPLMYTLTKKIIEKGGKGSKLPNLYIQRFPYIEYKENRIINSQFWQPSYFVAIMMFFLIIIVIMDINREVRTIEKQVLMIRGFRSWMIWTTWFLRFVIPLVIFSLLSIAILFWDTRYGPIYGYSRAFLIFLLIFLYGMLCFSVGCLLAVICPSGNILIAVFPNLFLLSILAYGVMKVYVESFKNYCLVLLFPSLILGFDIVSTYENAGHGVHWSNIVETNDIDKFALGLIYLILICEIIFFLLVAVLVEAIIRRKDELFAHNYRNLFKKVTPTDVHPLPEEAGNEEFFDDEPTQMKPGIQIMSVSKDYGPNHVLRNVSLNMYEDQITMLLGHNGAGKTTLISILNGLKTPSHGTAIINGFDIFRERLEARDSLSICFQQDILMDYLTVLEHLVFSLVLKGTRRRSSKKEIDEILQQLSLQDKAHEYVKNLSGGMQRKVSVAMTLCGNAKVVMLDEPTAGLDPASRRNIWDFIEKSKKGRTILMTTHYMDEADVLGDRIAIMCHGRVVCCGSSFFLKKKYGTGYHLIIDRTPSCIPRNVTALIRQYIPGTQIDLVAGTELFYSLPSEYSTKFPKMLLEIENNSQKLGIETFGISLTDLEEVFMKVGSSGSIKSYKKADEGSAEDTKEEIVENKVSGSRLFMNQSWAMFYKYEKYISRKFFDYYIPVIIAIFIAMILKLNMVEVPVPSMNFHLKNYDRPIAIVEKNTFVQESFISSLEEEVDHIDFTKNITERIFEMWKSAFFTVKYRYIVGASFGTETAHAWFNGEAYHSLPLSVQVILQHSYKSLMGNDYHIEFTSMPIVYDFMDLAKWFLMISNAFMMFFVVILLSSIYVNFYAKERVTAFKHLQFISGINIIAFHLSSLIFNYFLYIILTAIIVIIIYIRKPIGIQSSEEIGILCLILVCFGIYAIAFNCLFAYVGSNVDMITGLLQLLMIVPVIPVFILQTLLIIDDWIIFIWVAKVIFPVIALFDAIYILFGNQPCEELVETCMRVMQLNRESCRQHTCLWIKCCGYDGTSLRLDLLIMISVGLLLFVIIMIIDLRVWIGLAYRMGFGKKQPKVSGGEQDEDVLKEASFVSTYNIGRLRYEYVIIIKDLTKCYRKLTAVDGLSLTVRKAECFGLLGVNGAGKTTTFKMMTGLEMISHGDCWINGYSIKHQYEKARKCIGYCSQFGAFLPGLTARETMEIIFLIRGVPSNQIKNDITELARSFDFEDHLDKNVEDMSGGNKRKLSSSLALIGNPPIVFLDEPTTGMDPATKHFFWDAIHKIRARGTSIILTSHSMEECEALCTRLAIMVKGKFQCIGSVQHLKSRFARGMFIMIKLRKANRTDVTVDGHTDTSAVEQFMAETFPTAALKEKHNELLRYETESSDMRWSEVFEILENMKTQFNVEDYAVGQPNLEQIFLKFSKHGEKVEDPQQRKKRWCC